MVWRICARLAGGFPQGLTGLLTASLLVGVVAPAAGQTTVIHGRVEDALSRTALSAVTVFSQDSSWVAVTDSLGVFALQLPTSEPLRLLVERVGYQTSWFQLPKGAAERRSVLRLQPAPIELTGVDVVGVSAVTETLQALERRRNGYFGAVRAYDRLRLEDIAPVGTVWDFVRREAVYAFPCSRALSGLCARQYRGWRSMSGPPAPESVVLCLDGRDSWVGEFQSLDIESVALVEIYRGGMGGIRVYTPGFITSRAGRGADVRMDAELGC